MLQVEKQHLIAALDGIEELNRAVRAPIQAAEVDAQGRICLGDVLWPQFELQEGPLRTGVCHDRWRPPFGEAVRVQDLIRGLQQVEELAGQIRLVLESAEVGEGGRLRFRTP